MTGLLINAQPWLSDDARRGAQRRLGDLLTFALEDKTPLQVHYLYPRNSSPQAFSLSKRYAIDNLGATYVGADPGFCFEAEGIRVFRISEIP